MSALTWLWIMPLEEQKRRMQSLYKAVTRYDVQQWANHMFREAKAIAAQEQDKRTGPGFRRSKAECH